jgi:hypothetical protein
LQHDISQVSIILQAVSAIAGAFRSTESRNFLQPELRQDPTELSSDYGQARVINNRNTLDAKFQFLDASQLSPSRQRALAETLVDELLELLKTSGEFTNG